MDGKNKYDYSLLRIDYPDRLPRAKDYIRVICSIHGVFSIKYGSHKKGQICQECIGVKPSGYWTIEKCLERAIKYSTPSEWKKYDFNSYSYAQQNGWLTQCTAHMIRLRKPNGYWTKERCIEDAKNYSTPTEWNLNSKAAFSIAWKNGWLDECCDHMKRTRKPNGYWNNKQRCIQQVLKYSSTGEWQKNHNSSYSAARKNGWLKECRKHMKKLK
jgi:hypothetical protein